MSVRKCAHPWHWLLVTQTGDCLPCSHGARPVGNLVNQSLDEIWNGELIREVRAAILADQVHPVCATVECPFQHHHAAFPEPPEPFTINAEFAQAFDEEWYLATHPHICTLVHRRELASGLEHFIRHGRAEGYSYQLRSAVSPRLAEMPNAIRALIEYSRGATWVQAQPVVVVLAVTTICNLRCVMCPQAMGLVTHPAHMPAELVDRAAGWLRTASRVLLSGVGEPMLAPAFWRTLELTAGRTDLWTRVNSNALLLTPERIETVLNSSLTEISFSLDAATPQTYAKIRGADFAETVGRIRAFCAARRRSANRTLDVSINMTLMIENIGEAPEFIDLAHDLGVDSVLFSQLHNFGDRPDWIVARDNWTFHYSEQRLTLAPDLARHYLVAARARAETLGLPMHFHGHAQGYLEMPLAIQQ